MATFKKAEKKQSRLRLALEGPSGSGKTMSALLIASGLGQRIAVIDTEHGSASLYSDRANFDVCELTTFGPADYVSAIKSAEAEGYDVIVIDSLSHAWAGKGGALELVDQAARRSKSGNSYTAWRDVTPLHNQLVDAIIQCRAHVVATLRVKTEYVVEQNDRGKSTPRKVGLAPIQREGLSYEFTVVGEIDLEHHLSITKTRCPALTDRTIQKPGAALGKELLAWLNSGAPVAPEPARSEAVSVQAKTGTDVPTPAERAEIVASEAIANAQTEAELRVAFGNAKAMSMGAEEFARVVALKDKRKAELAAVPRQPGEEG